MNWNCAWLGRGRWLALVAGLLLGLAEALPATAFAEIRVAFPAVQIALSAAGAAPGLAGRVHRMASRAERSLRRLSAVVGTAMLTWLWVLLSTVAFLVVAAVASAVDLRMFDVRQQRAEVVGRDLGHGVRMFFRILRDARTPYLPRALLVLALLYWLLPVDIVGDGVSLVGLLDDVLVTVVAAKLFIRLCPDDVVEAHATALRANA